MENLSDESPSVLDIDALMTRVDFDKEFAADLMRLFLEDGPKRVEALKQGLYAQDPQLAAKSAHSLKGMSGTLCAPELMNTALEIEMAIKEERENDLDALHLRIENLTSRLLQEINDWLKQ
ncbi:MAG: Hpt domain-containing protein [Desulfovibrio sp.]|uniref:Hpt domain-containing protein n=1 Tax=Desulfovibrio sp. 7SRBS1 TaxID=3378064 RepID=UPI003B3C5675